MCWFSTYTKNKKFHCLSPSELYPPSNRRLSAKLVPTFCRKRVPHGQHDGSLRPYSRICRSKPLLFLSSSSSVVLMRLWTLFHTHYFSENLVALGLKLGPLDLWPIDYRNSLSTYNVIIYFCIYKFCSGLGMVLMNICRSKCWESAWTIGSWLAKVKGSPNLHRLTWPGYRLTTHNYCIGQECVDLYIHSLIHIHGIMFN
jgi:hypothetical protein